ncbi:MAG: thiamine phosphate synthase [Pseudomonadota bacterium]
MTILRGLYVITDRELLANRLIEAVEEALRGGARIVQYRDKGADQARREHEAKALLALCRRYHVSLLINDDVDLAQRVGADGVHLGQEDLALTEARARLGEQAMIGVSCYNRLDLAQAAQEAGADYVAFGRFFSSQTKPNAVQASLDLLRQAKRELRIPVAAIGGVTPENGRSLVEAGADMLAVIHGVFGPANIEATAARYAALFGIRKKPDE